MMSLSTGQPLDVPNVILDTDLGSDIGDALALYLLNVLADRGECRILGVICCWTYTYSAPCAQAFLQFFGRQAVPVGVNKGPAITPGPTPDTYNQYIAQNFPNASNGLTANIPDATTIYRTILAAAQDSSVTIICVGGVTTLSHLYDSTSDAISPLTGIQLIAQKVKRVVFMGGDYLTGAEYNFQGDPPRTVNFINNNAGRMEFAGYTIGLTVKTGQSVLDNLPTSNPIRKACDLWKAANPTLFPRESWDQFAILHAIRQGRWGTSPIFGQLNTGSNVIAGDGSNSWNSSVKNQAYLRKQFSDASLFSLIELLQQQPPALAGN